MARLTSVVADQVWAEIDAHRARTAAMLQALSDDQWDRPSLCDGWTVRHVAAHLTMQQLRIRNFAAFVLRHPTVLRGGTLNALIHDAAVIQSRTLSERAIVTRILTMIGSRRHNAFVSPLGSLTDALVHSQDIALPLGLPLELPPQASALAASHVWARRNSWEAGVFRPPPLGDYRLSATDTDWERGEGVEVMGPIGALLLLLTGRNVALDELTGPGVAALRRLAQAPARQP